MEAIAPSAVFEAEAVLFGYDIFNLGSYPGIFPVEHNIGRDTCSVLGDLWYVTDPNDLERLNQYEGSQYNCIPEVCLTSEGENINCYVYVLKERPNLKPLNPARWGRQ